MPHINRRAAKQLRNLRPRPKTSKTPTVAGPHTVGMCIKQFHEQRASSDQWLVAICQHIAIQRLSRMDVADMLLEMIRTTGMTKQEAWTCAGRLHRLSKDEDTLRNIKYGLQPYATRMTISKLPF